MHETTTAKRITRAKQKITEARIPYRLPADDELDPRLTEVLAVIYLFIQRGYLSTAERAQSRDLVDDAEWLVSLLHKLMPTEPEVVVWPQAAMTELDTLASDLDRYHLYHTTALISAADSAAPTRRPGPLIAAPSSSPPTPPNGPSTTALLGMIRLVSRQPVVDAIKLALYRQDYYGAGDLTHEAMRRPSAWSVGDRELMAAFVAKANESPFCIAAHSATSSLWYGDHAKVTATLTDLDTAPVEEPLRATLHMLGKLTREHAIDADDIRGVLSGGVSPAQIEDALAVCLAFAITARPANAFDFAIATPAAMEAGARHLLKRGYR